MKRGWVLFLALGLCLVLFIVVCVPEIRQVEDKAIPAVTPGLSPGSAYGQAPQLAGLVTAGKLPPVDQRLPLNPLLIQPEEHTGDYGLALNREACHDVCQL